MKIQIAITTEDRYIATSPDFPGSRGIDESVNAAIGDLFWTNKKHFNLELELSKGAIDLLCKRLSQERENIKEKGRTFK